MYLPKNWGSLLLAQNVLLFVSKTDKLQDGGVWKRSWPTFFFMSLNSYIKTAEETSSRFLMRFVVIATTSIKTFTGSKFDLSIFCDKSIRWCDIPRWSFPSEKFFKKKLANFFFMSLYSDIQTVEETSSRFLIWFVVVVTTSGEVVPTKKSGRPFVGPKCTTFCIKNRQITGWSSLKKKLTNFFLCH